MGKIESIAAARGLHPDKLKPCSGCRIKSQCDPNRPETFILLTNPNPGKEVACNTQGGGNFQETITSTRGKA